MYTMRTIIIRVYMGSEIIKKCILLDMLVFEPIFFTPGASLGKALKINKQIFLQKMAGFE